jgi:hypothetical protein
MNTKLIMTLSAVTMAVIGIGLTFFPAEILQGLAVGSSTPLLIILQLLGALYFGFAMLNWMTKGAVIGGIYNKPVSVANAAHFLIGGLALIKALINNPGSPCFLWALGCVYLVFAVCFGIIFNRHPANNQTV